MTTTIVKGLAFDAAVAPLVPRMGVVNEHREALQRLQDVWDQLTLLGQMSGIAADMSATAGEFSSLTQSLLDSLARRLLANAKHEMSAKAQMAIDMLVRNLFERTADVGFLATDNPVRDFLISNANANAHVRQGANPHVDAAALARMREALEARFRAYVAKYSVYDDVIVLSPSGEVLARLDDSRKASHCAHALVQQSARPGVPFVESFGEFDVLDARRGLIYSAAIRHASSSQLLGILCLSFRFDDEMDGIFSHLSPAGERGAVVLIDHAGTVIASSDAWQLPLGARLCIRANRDLVYFAGREYLAVIAKAHAYQGYAGPPWAACALTPVEQAFAPQQLGDEAAAARAVSLPPGAMDSSTLFGEELRRIPRQALEIQKGLERSVWNGQVHGRKRVDSGSSGRFSAVLLQQVTATGERIRGVFEQTISELQRSAANSVLEEARFSAALGIDILDRNLYERANDCRWWALDERLQRALLHPEKLNDAASVLRHINSLYTVYSRLLLLDAGGAVVASSAESAADDMAGVDPASAAAQSADWLRPVLGLRDQQAYVRSNFERSAFYAERHTYIYAAAVHTPRSHGAPIGAVAVVFDGEPQFQAMLRDALPRDANGAPLAQAIGLFVTREGQVIASTDPQFSPGSQVEFQAEVASMARGESRETVIEIGADLFAAGVSMSRGYREYLSSTIENRDDIACLILIRLCQRAAIVLPPERLHSPPVLAADPGGAPSCEVASFRCGSQWLALKASDVLEAVDRSTLTVLPGSLNSIAGLMKYHDEPLPVLELRASRLIAGANAVELSDRRPIIVCETAERRFGLRVDELGSVFDVAPSVMQPLPDCMARHDPLAEALIYTRDTRDMIILLSASQILLRLKGMMPGSAQPLTGAPPAAAA